MKQKLSLITKTSLAGYYRVRVTNAETGKQRLDTGWFSNLITDWGLNYVGSNSAYFEYCHIGQGNSTPLVGNTTLDNWVASTNNDIDIQAGTESSAPYYMWQQRTYRFAEGAAAGTLQEVGVGPLGGSTDELFSRALIVDGGGNPVSITVLSNEILDVDYQLRIYAPTSDVTASLTDSGTSTTHTVTLRACNVDSGSFWPGNRIDNDYAALAAWASVRTTVYDGAIGASITDVPTGNLEELSGSNDAYVDSSLQNTGSLFLGLNDGNLAGGSIAAMWFLTEALGTYQVGFSPAITKDNTVELTLKFGVSWDRRP